MSNYYDYRDIKVMIAHKLMSMEGWKVYGYKPDNSDAMVDYWDPANWGGVAEKNGYILCVNVYGEAEKTEIREYSSNRIDKKISDKIQKLEQVTISRGATESEEKSAKEFIAKLKSKTKSSDSYVATGYVPAHQAHPPKMNWHIEKDGVIIEKGNGILKFKDIHDYYTYTRDIENMKRFREDKDAFKQELIFEYICRWNESKEGATKCAENYLKSMEEKAKLVDKFEKFINKIDTTCGGLLGSGDSYIYENVTVTEYKKEIKAVEKESGSIKEGQCFILKSSFNYGCNKGYVYRIHETPYGTFTAYKLNGKLTKECTGMANKCNTFPITGRFAKFVSAGHIAWCELEEVKTPYEVQKVVKKKITTEAPKAKEESTPDKKSDIPKYTYNVYEDVDTRTNEKIYLVKIVEKLTKDEYIKVNKYIKTIGGYYSKFKHAFLFKENPATYFN